MGLKEGLVQTGVLLSVFVGIGYVILAKMRKNNPAAADWLGKLKLGNIYNKVEEDPITDKIEQVYDERRTLM